MQKVNILGFFYYCLDETVATEMVTTLRNSIYCSGSHILHFRWQFFLHFSNQV